MARDQYLFRRQGRYYVRRRVPQDLVAEFGQEQIVKSLFTSDYREATGLAIKAAAEIQHKFDAMRGRITAAFIVQDAPKRTLDDLPLRETENIVFTWFRRETQLLQNSGSARNIYEEEPQYQAEVVDFADEKRESEGYAHQLNGMIIRLMRSSGGDVEAELMPTMVAICAAEGLACNSTQKGPIKSSGHQTIVANRTGSKYRIFLDLVRRGQIQLYRLQVAELTGQLVEIDDADFRYALKPPYRRKRGAVTLAELIEEFKNDPNRRGMRKKLELDYGLLFKAMDEVIGHEKRLSDITRDDCKEVANLLERIPANATKHFPNLSLIEAASKLEAMPEGTFKKLNEVTVTSYLHKMNS